MTSVRRFVRHLNSFSPFAVLAAFLFVLPYACDSADDTVDAVTSSTKSTVTGVGGGSSCNNGIADEFCVPLGPAAEDCSCADCLGKAMCQDLCKDDDNCDLDGDEDCSCADCYHKVPSCSPGGGNCSDPDPESNNFDPACAFGERCTCIDCTATPFCNDNCVDNGECVPWLEGCSCADCKDNEDCTMAGATTSTSGAGGTGGANSAGGAGGMTATSGAGGAGGA